MKPGPARNYAMISKVVRLHKKGLSFREIGERLVKPGEKPKDVKTVHTWYKFGVGELSTPSKKGA